MRILVVIPHYFAAEGDNAAVNRSRRPNARRERLSALCRVLTSLHFAFGNQSYGLIHSKSIAKRAKPRIELSMVVATTGDNHLLADLPPPIRAMVRHAASRHDPLRLGFLAHRILAAEAGKFDYYVYLEDDVAIHDPSFFLKRKLFDAAHGPDALLQPQRYELGGKRALRKLYVDYAVRLSRTAPYQDITDHPRISFDFAGEPIELQRSSYPSSGCFILNAEQLRIWSQGPAFQDGDESYFSPLDSAATLSVMKTFRIYKPTLTDSWFLEVEHVSPRWIGLLDQASPVVRT